MLTGTSVTKTLVLDAGKGSDNYRVQVAEGSRTGRVHRTSYRSCVSRQRNSPASHNMVRLKSGLGLTGP